MAVAPLKTLTYKEFQKTKYGSQGQAGYTRYLTYVANHRAARAAARMNAPDSGLQPLSFPDFTKQAQQYVSTVTKPQYDLIGKTYQGELASGQDYTKRLAGALGQYLTPIYDRVKNAYDSQIGAVLAGAGAIGGGLKQNLGSQNASLQNYLQLSGAPASYGENAQGLAQNVGQTFDVNAKAGAAQLGTHGAADETFAAGLPGLAALRGLYDFNNLQRQLTYEASQSRDKVTAGIPQLMQDLFTQYRTGEENKAIARAAYPKQLAQTSQYVASTAADWSRATGFKVSGVDGSGNPVYVRDKKGNPVPVKTPTTKNPPGSLTPANTRTNDRVVLGQVDTYLRGLPGLTAPDHVDPNTGIAWKPAKVAQMIKAQLVAKGWSGAKDRYVLHEQVLRILASLGYEILPEWHWKKPASQKKK